ncbi:MAG: helix-turn-helix domain-containing protein [Actinomycetota bacterium]
MFAAVADTITERGPHRWTLDEIAERVGLTGPALGFRFGSKRKLLIAFAADQPAATADRFHRITTNAQSARAAIIDSLTALTASMTTQAEVANNVAMLGLDLADAELRAYAAEQAGVIKTALASTIRSTAPDGDSAEGDAAAAAEYIYVVWSGALIAWAIAGRGTISEAVGRALDQCLDHLDID